MEEVYRYIYDHGGRASPSTATEPARSRCSPKRRARRTRSSPTTERGGRGDRRADRRSVRRRRGVPRQRGRPAGDRRGDFGSPRSHRAASDRLQRAQPAPRLPERRHPALVESRRATASCTSPSTRTRTGCRSSCSRTSVTPAATPTPSRRRSRKSSRRRSARASIPRRSSTSYRVPGARKSRGTKASRSSRSRTRSAPRFGATSTTMSIRDPQQQSLDDVGSTVESPSQTDGGAVDAGTETDAPVDGPADAPTADAPTPRTTRLAPTTRCKNSSRRANARVSRVRRHEPLLLRGGLQDVRVRAAGRMLDGSSRRR